MSATIEPPPLTMNDLKRAHEQLLRIGGQPMRPTNEQTEARLNRRYGKGISHLDHSRHIQSTVHYLNRWLRWLNFGIVY